ncbi:uncharacterized protein LOC131619648 [Vicia villosa]|uniref:uncharacterized protein LOC131619648 n=1 Tax=Vicia villosa TaxID=3911 RepID=UPI00273C8F50|nr:uncharacterized protein LOC131619648 [Vicia villosa]
MEKVTKLSSIFTTFLVLVLFSLSKYFPYIFTLLFVLLSTMILFKLSKKKELQSSLGDETSHNQSEGHSYPSQADPYSDSSLQLDSESSTSLSIDESFEIDLRRNQDNDDDEDEEEEDLIEINISRSLDFIFKEGGLMDLLEEMNEDENLIEIDIFKGFSKYQDFRFKELACLGD